MINSQNLIDKINCAVNAGGLTALQTCQTNNATSILNSPVKCVSTFSNLPNSTTYAGRMFYVGDENKYYYPLDGNWSSNFSGELFNFADQIFSWGSTYSGRLGINCNAASVTSPVRVVGVFTDWCQVSSANQSSIGLRANGTVWTWGWNASGELGDNTNISRSSPVSVVGGFTDWRQVTGGGTFMVGVRTNGTAWTWGAGNYGQLGNNCYFDRNSPVSVVGGFTDWTQVTGGCRFALGLRSNGTLWGWGEGSSGQLGNNCTIARSSPVSVVGGFTDWCQVSSATSGNHSIGLRSNGTLWAWGIGSYGRLGDGTAITRSSPVSVVGGFTDWCCISAINNIHNFAIRTNGTAWTWGFNGSPGRLGDGTTVTRSSPVSVVGGFTDWCKLVAGASHSLGVRRNGTIWVWGSNFGGILGIPGCSTDIQLISPTLLPVYTGEWFDVHAGSGHVLAIRNSLKGI